MNDADNPIEIPYQELSPTALRGVIESFVLREGTDYGIAQYTLDEKIAQVLRQIERGDAQLFFEPKSQTVEIVRALKE
jgi:uncharacterized protein